MLSHFYSYFFCFSNASDTLDRSAVGVVASAAIETFAQDWLPLFSFLIAFIRFLFKPPHYLIIKIGGSKKLCSFAKQQQRRLPFFLSFFFLIAIRLMHTHTHTYVPCNFVLFWFCTPVLLLSFHAISSNVQCVCSQLVGGGLFFSICTLFELWPLFLQQSFFLLWACTKLSFIENEFFLFLQWN